VLSEIAEGSQGTIIESDDLLQCGCAVGGLLDSNTMRFEFCYFRDENNTVNMLLDIPQIEAIASGTTEFLELWRCSNSSCGGLHATEDSYCPNCDSIRHFDADYLARLQHWYPGERAVVIDSLMNLRRIVLAILDYVAKNEGKLPPPFTTDRLGNRLHSWRSLILPFLDLEDVYDAIDFSQPWDAPRNRSAAERIPDVYRPPGTQSGRTRYSAIVGPQSLWPPTGGRRLTDVKSGTSYTIAVVEAPCSEVEWMKPHDFDEETLVREVAASKRPLPAAWIDGRTTLLADLDAARIRELASV
jgi:Protein of unknown function (DUF1559)